MPRKQSSRAFDPENAAPYRVAGGWQPVPQGRSDERMETQNALRRAVIGVSKQAEKLAETVATLNLNTDPSGAGGLAGLAGMIGGGGVPGGGGGRRRGTGGPPGGGPPRRDDGREPGSAGDGSPEALARDREKFKEEMKDPRVRAKMLQLAVQEVGHNPRDIQQFIETIFNRASARRQTLDQAMQVALGYRGGVRGGQYPNLGKPENVTADDRKAFDPSVDDVFRGSDYSNRSTGNASGRVNRNLRTRARSSKDERYVLEDTPSDIKWHKGIPTVVKKPNVPPNPNPNPNSNPTTIDTTGAFPSPITGELWQGPGASRGRRTHQGQDIGAPVGTPIYSMGKGVLMRQGFQGGITGGIVVIRYENGIEAKYMHLSNWSILKDKNVTAGQVIALSGATGAPGISPHLHVEYRDIKTGRLLRASEVHGYGPQGSRGKACTAAESMPVSQAALRQARRRQRKKTSSERRNRILMPICKSSVSWSKIAARLLSSAPAVE